MRNVKKDTLNLSEHQIQERLDQKAQRKDRLTSVLPYVGLIFLIVLFCCTTGGRFQSADNLKSILNQTYTLAIIVLGGSFLYSIGVLDMSIGSVLGVCSLVIAICVSDLQFPLWLSFLLGMLVAIGCMCINSAVKIYLRVDPFIGSMCMMNICAGIQTSVTASRKVYFATSDYMFINHVALKITVLVALFLVGLFLFNHTVIGKQLKIIGGSPTVAKLSGINITTMTYIAYIFTGICIVVSAFFLLGRTGSVEAGTGNGLNLNVLTAVVLGGFPLNGGAGSRFTGPLVGALTITVLMNGLSLLGYADVVGYLFKGVLFLIVVGLTYERSKGKLIN